jgi:DNA uptake protein ComE-like DNA-binding protein
MRAFFSGLGVGMALGFLYAPRRGEETRQRLTRATSKAGERTRGIMEKIPGGRRVVERVRESAQFVQSGISQRSFGSGATDILNAASREDLIAVPGIGPILADRIIQARPFTSEDEVVEKGILTRSAFDDVRRYLMNEKSA